jgi:hypothetical protein
MHVFRIRLVFHFILKPCRNVENDVKPNNVQHNKHPQANDINFTVGLVSRG